MIFLIEYERTKGKVIYKKSFKDSQKKEAEKSRLELELKLNRDGINHEVVLLEAESENALKITHQRYFSDISEIGKRYR
jgi:hypothetical protein